MMGQRVHFWAHFSLNLVHTSKEPKLEHASLQGHYPLPEQKKKLLKAKIAVALHDELGRVPKTEEIEQVFLMARVMYKAVLGLHFQRQQQKKNGQLAIF